MRSRLVAAFLFCLAGLVWPGLAGPGLAGPLCGADLPDDVGQGALKDLSKARELAACRAAALEADLEEGCTLSRPAEGKGATQLDARNVAMRLRSADRVRMIRAGQTNCRWQDLGCAEVEAGPDMGPDMGPETGAKAAARAAAGGRAAPRLACWMAIRCCAPPKARSERLFPFGQ